MRDHGERQSLKKRCTGGPLCRNSMVALSSGHKSIAWERRTSLKGHHEWKEGGLKAVRGNAAVGPKDT